MISVKTCGVTNEVDIRKAALGGADAIGVIASPALRIPKRIGSHTVGLEQASRLLRKANLSGLDGVLLPRTGDFDQIAEMVEATNPDRLQLGQVRDTAVTKALYNRFGSELEIAQVVQVGGTPRRDIRKFTGNAHYIHLDSPGDQPGGNGETHDWQASREIAKQVHAAEGLVILAGGLTVANVAEAIATVQRDEVDVETGIRNPQTDVYSQRLVRDFVAAAHGNGKGGQQ